MAVPTGPGAAMHGIRLHPVLPFADLHRAGEVDDRHLHDSAIRRVVGRIAAGRAVVHGPSVWRVVDRGGAVAGATAREIDQSCVGAGFSAPTQGYQALRKTNTNPMMINPIPSTLSTASRLPKIK